MHSILKCTGHEIRYPDIVRAENCTLYDAAGNSYLDLESGVWCTSIGHCHPRITRIIREQSEKIVHTGYCYLNPETGLAAQDLVRITGIGEGECLFLSSGSEAVEFCVSAVRSISENPYMLSLKDSYLSAFGSAGKRSPDHWILFDWKKNDDIRNIPFDSIAAFVFEPGSSSGLVGFPPYELISEITEKVRAHGGFIIANEVTTGMGRTGTWFGYQHYGITPDMVALGKGLGAGYPVSAAVLSHEAARKMTDADFHYGQSHQNDPLGARIAREVIAVIEEERLLEKCVKDGAGIVQRLESMKETYGIIKEIRGRGLMLAVECEAGGEESPAEQIFRELLKRKIILVKRPGREVLRIDPALTIPQRDKERFLSAMEEILRAVSLS